MAAAQHDASDEREARQRKWTEPEPDAVTAQIEAFSALANGEFARKLASFIATDNDDRDQAAAYAIRSPQLVRKARRLIPDLVREPGIYLPEVPGESINARTRRLVEFRKRADHESQLLFAVHAGMVARRGHLIPESSPRSRARRLLADEYPVRFLELVRTEEAADKERKATAAADRKRAREQASTTP
ncbi:hypothetical protein [Streptomyces sp. NPDC050428]|uniref:hypothetical protein n=1 Tax=Streptomyces sp. NPDC050428 TaxID=3155757 RepID=UPI00343803F1